MSKTFKKAYILNQKIDKEFNAAGKAMRDVFEVFTNNGVKIMPGVPKTAHKIFKILDFPILIFYMIFVLGKGDYCIFSYPENIAKIKLLKKLAPVRGVKVVCFINDINSIREGNFDHPDVKANIERDMDIINCASIVMAPNKNSKEFLSSHGVDANILTVGTWDYIMDSNPRNDSDTQKADIQENDINDKCKIAFAGNLNKAPFIEKFDDIDYQNINIEFIVWGNYDGDIPTSSHMIYKGSVAPEKLPFETAKCDFGLVWDGVSVHECEGGLGEYLRYNNSHKCGLYLASGIPVFVWRNSGLADFVKSNECGFLIDNLDQIPQIIANMTKDDYENVMKNVKVVSENIRKGYYLKRVLEEMFTC